MPRLVRRRPLWERITTMMNPMDFLLWLSEEMETREWESKLVGTQLGLGLNFIFLIARANIGSSTSTDDVFSDDDGVGWLALCLYPLVWGLIIFSITNAIYTMLRTRKYRMFEANIDVQIDTPSARRVRVQSSPASSSPLRYLTDLVTPDTADSRAHPDRKRDVWELSVWDPVPISLRLLCFFSPGHILVYALFLPLAPLDPRPSVTIFNLILVQAVLSAQLLVLSSRFAQQAKDNAIIQKEVMHEYDTKFVHPQLHPIVRDAGTQISDEQPANAREFVQLGTPTTLIKRTFRTNGNPYIDQDTAANSHNNVMRAQMFTPPPASRPSDSTKNPFSHEKAAFRNSLPITHTPVHLQTNHYANSPASSQANVGGHMSVHNHASSPLKKTTSVKDRHSMDYASPRNSREMAAFEQTRQRNQTSPAKQNNTRQSFGVPSSYSTDSLTDSSWRNQATQKERYPSRWY